MKKHPPPWKDDDGVFELVVGYLGPAPLDPDPTEATPLRSMDPGELAEAHEDLERGAMAAAANGNYRPLADLVRGNPPAKLSGKTRALIADMLSGNAPKRGRGRRRRTRPNDGATRPSTKPPASPTSSRACSSSFTGASSLAARSERRRSNGAPPPSRPRS